MPFRSHNQPAAPNQKTSVTVANGATVSSEAQLGSLRLVGIHLPATIDGTAITFQVSGDNGITYSPLYDGLGNQMSLTVAAGRVVLVDPSNFACGGYLKLVMGTTQTALRTIYLIVGPVMG